MARSIAFLPISFSLWMGMSGTAAGQAIMESGPRTAANFGPLTTVV